MDLMYAAHLPAGEGPFPTIIALHGWGASAHDLLGLAPYLHAGQAIMLCPQGPLPMEIGPGAPGYGWFPITTDAPPDPGEFRKAADLVRGFVDAALERYPIDRRHVVVLGFSQGGVVGYDLALRDPARYAGLVALSAWLPDELVGSLPRLPEHENFPTLLIHGTEDPMIPVERAQASRDNLGRLGISPVYREFPMQHEIGPEALRTLIQWLEDKVLNLIQLV